MLAIEYHIHIWKVSPQLSCGGTCQIRIIYMYCCDIENVDYGEIY